jgi:hypothetical protein
MTQAAQSIGANKVIFGNVQPVGTDAFLVTLKLLDSQRGVVESWISEQIAKVQTTPISLRGPVQKWFGTLTGQAIPGSLKLTGGVIGAGVWVDGVQSGLLGAGGLTISGVGAGPHHLAVTKAGYEKFERNITMASGATETVAVQLSAIEGADVAEAGPAAAMDLSSPLTTPPPESTASTKVGSLIAGYALAGLGIASVGFGIYSSSRISDVNSKLDKYRRYPCVSGAGDVCKSDGKTVIGARTAAEDQYVKDQQNTGSTYSSLQWVGYGVGAAALVGSVMLLVHGYSNDSSSATASASHSNLLVMPSFSPDGAGAMAYLTF